MAIDTTGLQTISELNDTTRKLAKDCKKWISDTEYFIDVQLVDLRSKLTTAKTSAEADNNFSQSEVDAIQAAIDKINAAIGA